MPLPRFVRPLALSLLALQCAGCPAIVARLLADDDPSEEPAVPTTPPPQAVAPFVPPRPPRPPQAPRPEAQAMPRSVARWIEAPLARASRAGRPRPLRAAGWSLFDSAERVDRLVLGRRVGARTEAALYDLSSDQLLPQRYREPHRYDRDRTIFVPRGARGPSTSVVSVRTGLEVTPRPVDRDGAPLALTWTALDEDTGQLVVLGRSADGALLAGSLDASALREREPVVTLEQPAPFEPTRYSFGGGSGGLDLERYGGNLELEPRPGDECIRARFARDASARCVAWGRPSQDRFAHHRLVFLGDAAWSDYQLSRERDLRAERWSATPVAPGASCQTLKQLREPPAALITCREGGARVYYHHDARARRWRRWEEPESLHHRMGDGAQTRQILESFEPSLEGPADLWIDLERGELVQTDPLLPLRFASHHDRLVPLQRRGEDGALELVLLDFGQRTLQVLARFRDCASPGYLAVQAEEDGVIAFGCQVQPNPTLFRFRFRWSRAVDVRTGQLYDLPGQALDVLARRREVIVSASLANAAETDLPQGVVSRIALARP